VTTLWKYQVDGEVGRFEFATHQIFQAGELLYDSAQEIFPARRCSEWYKTSGFKEIAYIYGAIEESYRKTSRLLNRVRHQLKEGTPSRTVREQAEGEGTKLMQRIDRKAEQILQAHGFREDGGGVKGSLRRIRGRSVSPCRMTASPQPLRFARSG
jgi:hypothetical protein